MRISGIYNIMEQYVFAEVERCLRAADAAICRCPLCMNDMAAYALNRIPARYVTTREGEQRAKTGLAIGHTSAIDHTSMVSKVVGEAIEHVSKHPHRENRTMTESTIEDLLIKVEESTHLHESKHD